MFWLIVVTILVFNPWWSLLNLLRHLYVAKTRGIPYIIFPFFEQSILYNIFCVTPLGVWFFLRGCPKAWRDYFLFSTSTWRMKVRSRYHDKYGPVIMLISPLPEFSISLSDAAAVTDIVNRPKAFPKPLESYKALRIYGNNVVTTEGAEWQRHRKITQVPFNERNSNAVWRASINQALELMSPWNSSPEADHYVEAPMRQLALNVISSAGFGVDTSSDDPHFAPGVVPPGYTRPFSEALSFFLSNTVKIVATHYTVPRFLCSFGIFRTLDLAKQDVGGYLRQLLKKELALGANSADDRSNLISLLAAQKGGLTDDEIVGNIFIFSIAGHDTTASTLQFTFALMALHPEVQSWLQQELDEVLKDFPEDPAHWSYPELFPELVAPLCVMFEVLRLWSVVGLLPKWTADSEQVVGGFRLPARTHISLNIPALHYSKKDWGADADEFRPQRWHPKNTESTLEEPGSGSNGLRRPVKGAWLPFSDGARACLGKKFAQVEYCAVAAAVFSKWEVRPTGEEGKRKIEKCMSDSGTYSTLRISGDWKVKMVKRPKKRTNPALER